MPGRFIGMTTLPPEGVTKRGYFGASLFGSVLGICGLGQAWRLAPLLWGAPRSVGPALLLLAFGTWLGLLIVYGLQALRNPLAAREEFLHTISGSTPALLGISTLLTAIAAQSMAPRFGFGLGIAGLCWQLSFSLSGIRA